MSSQKVFSKAKSSNIELGTSLCNQCEHFDRLFNFRFLAERTQMIRTIERGLRAGKTACNPCERQENCQPVSIFGRTNPILGTCIRSGANP
jgi:hypothetical protein